MDGNRKQVRKERVDGAWVIHYADGGHEYFLDPIENEGSIPSEVKITDDERGTRDRGTSPLLPPPPPIEVFTPVTSPQGTPLVWNRELNILGTPETIDQAYEQLEQRAQDSRREYYQERQRRYQRYRRLEREASRRFREALAELSPRERPPMEAYIQRRMRQREEQAEWSHREREDFRRHQLEPRERQFTPTMEEVAIWYDIGSEGAEEAERRARIREREQRYHQLHGSVETDYTALNRERFRAGESIAGGIFGAVGYLGGMAARQAQGGQFDPADFTAEHAAEVGAILDQMGEEAIAAGRGVARRRELRMQGVNTRGIPLRADVPIQQVIPETELPPYWRQDTPPSAERIFRQEPSGRPSNRERDTDSPGVNRSGSPPLLIVPRSVTRGSTRRRRRRRPYREWRRQFLERLQERRAKLRPIAHGSRTYSTARFREVAIERIIAQEGHLLEFLLDPSTGNFALPASRQHSDLADSITVQIGHVESYHGGGTERLALQDAWTNQFEGQYSERYGDIIIREVIDIDGVPVMLQTAKMWEDLGLLPVGTVARSPISGGWIDTD